MATCPRCRYGLRPAERGLACPSSHGVLLDLRAVRAALGARARERLAEAVRAAPPGTLPCPACGQPTRAVRLHGQGGGVEVDVCGACAAHWFDAGEMEAVEAGPGKDRKGSRGWTAPLDVLGFAFQLIEAL